MSTRLLVWTLAIVVLFGALAIGGSVWLLGDRGGEAEASATVPSAAVDRFDGRRAYGYVRAQVDRGPRPAGSAASRSLADWLRKRLPNGRVEQVPGGLRNVVGTLPGSKPAIVIGAHYDTKVMPNARFVGANDGAGGTAVVLELARALRRIRRPAGAPELRFVLFDGEESPDDNDDDFLTTGLRGSRAYAGRHASELGAMVLVDFVGQRGLRLPREGGSNEQLWDRLRAAANTIGVGDVFPDRSIGEIYDDHTPFARAHVPAIDLIDWDYRCFHTACDTLAQIDQRSLDATGEALIELLRQRSPAAGTGVG
ncbi:MAG TPA: M28 family metallopeptidase [Conexibacter sp.]